MEGVASTSTSRNKPASSNKDNVETELLYLMVKFLSVGPCKKSYEVLKSELEENKLLPKRIDWLGNEHEKSFKEYDRENGHIRGKYLQNLVSKLGSVLQKLEPSLAVTKSTLLGAGAQYLLRADKENHKEYKNLRSVIQRHRNNVLLEPVHRKAPPNVVFSVVAREMRGNFNRFHFMTNKFYHKLQLMSRKVGHLSAVYCMLFDRRGRFIITGADDMLVKIWSVTDGRVVVTLRGASAEISDLAIDHENTLVAAGSCDKIIRVWSLQTLAPVAVLTRHTGMITALQFCPAPDNEGVLVSTGGDGCVAFWTYTKEKDNKVQFDSFPLKLNEKVRPGHSQLICASFSCGGTFLAVGGADSFVRVYRLGAEEGVDKLLEVKQHNDRVDSIQWAHNKMVFVSGSRDGTALIWRFEAREWKSRELKMTELLPGVTLSEEVKRLQVTMVGWDRQDTLVVTASTDHLVRLWDSSTGQLKHILKGHEDNAYVIEAHPIDARLIFTAGHDGQLFIWDVHTGVAVKSFKNTIEGQGYGALYDANWAPDGLSIAATDSHGHILIFAMGSDQKFKKVPDELFFHTDYRPLVRDVNHHVLDEQTQTAPHLMPPPFLVNIDGEPYAPQFQRLVPGREKCTDDQLVPNVILNDNGEQEVIDGFANDNEPIQAPDAEVPPVQTPNAPWLRNSEDEAENVANEAEAQDAEVLPEQADIDAPCSSAEELATSTSLPEHIEVSDSFDALVEAYKIANADTQVTELDTINSETATQSSEALEISIPPLDADVSEIMTEISEANPAFNFLPGMLDIINKVQQNEPEKYQRALAIERKRASAIENVAGPSTVSADPSISARVSIDDMIQRLDQERRAYLNKRAAEAEPPPPGPSSESEPASTSQGFPRFLPPDHNYSFENEEMRPVVAPDPLANENVEGVRNTLGNWHRNLEDMKWKRRTLIPCLSDEVLKASQSTRSAHGAREVAFYEEEDTKKPEVKPDPTTPVHELKLGRRKAYRRQKKTPAYSTRASREANQDGSSTSRAATTDRTIAAFGNDFADPNNIASSNGNSSGSSSSGDERRRNKNEDGEARLEESSSSPQNNTTDYSDWTADVGMGGLVPPERTAYKQKSRVRRKRRKKKKPQDDDDDDDDMDGGEDENRNARKKTWEKKVDEQKTKENNLQTRNKGKRKVNFNEAEVGFLEEVPLEYRPPEWLCETLPKKAPYFPQMGDRIMYFKQGHKFYVDAVTNRTLYHIDQDTLPWNRKKNLKDQEYVQIIGMRYEIRPPRLVCLKLGILDGNGSLTNECFTIKYHDMPDVLDFLVLKNTWDAAIVRNWATDHRFRCIIDDAWWLGTVESVEPLESDSVFLCYRVLWDNGEKERLSPWDMEPIDETVEMPELGGSLAVSPAEYKKLVYTPSPEDWGVPSFEAECERLAEGFGRIMGLAVAEPFLVPVDLNIYPNYAMVVEYPMDLSTIKSRLESHFYRRPNAAQFDVRYIATNAEKFNKKGTVIVKHGRIITELALKLIQDRSCYDPTVHYHDLQKNYQSPDSNSEDGNVLNIAIVESSEENESRASRKARPKVSLKGPKFAHDNRPWQVQCRSLLKNMFEKNDSAPFRFPIDLHEFCDYSRVIDVPMDLTTIKEELSAGGYQCPADFAKDIRLIFSNSKNYNTNSKSRVYSMTVRLEAYFEDQMKAIFYNHKRQGGRGGRPPKATTTSTRPSVVKTAKVSPLPKKTTFSEEKGLNRNKKVETFESPGPSTRKYSSESENTDDRLRGSIHEGGKRRSKRVAKLQRFCSSDESDEEYNPIGSRFSTRNTPTKTNSRPDDGGSGGNGFAGTSFSTLTTRGKAQSPSITGSKGGPIKRSSSYKRYEEDSDFTSPTRKMTNGTTSSKRVGGKYEHDSDFEAKTTTYIRPRYEETESEQEDFSKTKDKRINIKKIVDSSSDESEQAKVNILKESEGSCSDLNNDACDNDFAPSDTNDVTPEIEEKTDRRSRTKSSVATFGSRRKKSAEESEVEFDEDELGEDGEDDEDSDFLTKEEEKKKKAASRVKRTAPKRSTPSRRRRKKNESSDDELDQDYEVDQELIKEVEESSTSSSSSEDESDEDSDDERRLSRKRKRKISRKEKIEFERKKKNEDRIKKAVESRKRNQQLKLRRQQQQKKQEQKKKLSLKINEDHSYNVAASGSNIKKYKEIRLKGRVIGTKVVVNQNIQDSSFTPNMNGEGPAIIEGGSWLGSSSSCSSSSSSDEDVVSKCGRVRKRVRYNETDLSDESYEPNSVSSRGRVRKVNSRLYDFI